MPTAILEKQETKKTAKQKYRASIALYENSEEYTVFVELPGADEKAVQVNLDKGLLTIEAPLSIELPPDAQVKYSEMNLGSYRRTLNIADQIDEARIEATFKNGLLKLILPKSKNVIARKISIKTT